MEKRAPLVRVEDARAKSKQERSVLGGQVTRANPQKDQTETNDHSLAV